jgi:hypothetical protein
MIMLLCVQIYPYYIDHSISFNLSFTDQHFKKDNPSEKPPIVYLSALVNISSLASFINEPTKQFTIIRESWPGCPLTNKYVSACACHSSNVTEQSTGTFEKSGTFKMYHQLYIDA